MPEYVNITNKVLDLKSETKKLHIKLQPHQKVFLPKSFEKYVTEGLIARTTEQPKIKPPAGVPAKGPVPTAETIRRLSSPPPPPPIKRRIVQRRKPREVTKRPPSQRGLATARVVGQRLRIDATLAFQDAVAKNGYPISNGIGVGVLSYNRPKSLQRILETIVAHTNLNRTTVFVSDDASSDPEIKNILRKYAAAGIVPIYNSTRLGVAGNTNRLLRCLSRFQFGLLLNDDVEILQKGWDEYYRIGSKKSGLHHFCMRQPGVYGATVSKPVKMGETRVTSVAERPHGAILAYTSAAFQAVGYFDESFGLYGMEHVDWSTRIAKSGLQPAGFYDLADSQDYFQVHNEPSAVEDRSKHFQAAKEIYAAKTPQKYQPPTPASVVPKLSCVIPYRAREDRFDSICSVVNNIRAQRFPDIQIILAEQDERIQLPISNFGPVTHKLIPTGRADFNKAKAFNAGVACSTADVVLHDADMLAPGSYFSDVKSRLETHESCHVGATVIYLNPASTKEVNSSGGLLHKQQCDRVVGYFEGGSLALRRSIYWNIGGFQEAFWGYGVEDCEFFDRMKRASNLYDERYVKFIHLWHGRDPNWGAAHARNKMVDSELRSLSLPQRIAQLKQQNVRYM